MKLKIFIPSSVILLLGLGLNAQNVPQRPPITGVTHAAFFTKDLENTRQFFHNFLGYDEIITLPGRVEGIPSMIAFKINDRQYVEVFPEREANTNRMYHFAIETTDAEAMRVYLASKGYKVPETTPKGRTGNYNYFVTDSNGTICEIVQFDPDGVNAQLYGQNMPDSRIAARMSHVGFMVPDLDKAIEFYGNVLGFEEVWRGGPNEKVTWVHLKTPEGNETIEFMLYESDPSWDRMGSMNHICLEVKDVEIAKAILDMRTYPEGCRTPSGVNTGINRKRQVNYYNIDGTRVEIMEENTIDGVPTPSHNKPPMKYVPKNNLE
ncbi:MAG: VOC family protein [Bacteroidales bacterium]|nr:VOC family protein [Bacteroidales bacterium]MCL2133488.1 VOC family protein [Bacteroidales bacterium]